MNGRIIAIIGGAGHLGAALARRLGKAGHRILIGSRDPARAAAGAADIGASALNYKDAAADAELVIVTVPYQAQAEVLREISPHVAGKVVVDATVPLMPPKVMRVQLPEEGSAAVRAQALLGADVRLCSAFHNVAAHKLALDGPVDCDILVFGDDKEARNVVVSLVQDIGLRGLHGGVLANSAAAEALTSLLIFMNKTYAADGAGIRITGLGDVAI